MLSGSGLIIIVVILFLIYHFRSFSPTKQDIKRMEEEDVEIKRKEFEEKYGENSKSFLDWQERNKKEER